MAKERSSIVIADKKTTEDDILRLKRNLQLKKNKLRLETKRLRKN